MKYRIKIVTYENGRKTFTPQRKSGFLWYGLDWQGNEDLLFNSGFDSRDDALASIDKNHAGNTRKATIEFEYIQR